MIDLLRRLPRRTVVVVALILALVVGLTAWALTRSDGAQVPEASASPTAATSSSPEPQDTQEPAEPDEPTESPAEPAEPGADPPADPPTDGVDPSLPPVELDDVAPFGTEVSARLVSIEAVQGEAEGPGEVAGPAVRVTVEVVNGTAETIDLGATVVNAYAGPELRPLETLSGPGARWFEGSLAAGAAAEAVYVFNTPADLRESLQVTVSYDPEVPTVVFEGAAPPP